MIKILYFITDLDIGGAEKLLLSVLKKLNKNKYQPIVCCFYGGVLCDEVEKLGIKVFDLCVRSKINFSILPKFYSLLKQEKPDIVHTHLFHANIIGRVIARLAGVSIVISTQHYSSSFHGRWGIFLDRITAPLANKIIAVSAASKKFCVEQVGIPSERINVIHNGIDLDLINMQEAEQDFKKQLKVGNGIIIGSIGRFVKVKGYKYLFYAAVKICENYPNVKFALLGYGSLKDELIKLAKDLDISDKVIFIDSNVEVTKFLSIVDIYVLPSLTEGLSITLLEAMAMSKPVIATKVGGNPEVIVDFDSGLLVSPGDPDSLSKAIISLLKDNNFSNKIAFNARKKVEEKFGIDKMLEHTEALYDSLVAGR